MAEMKREFHGIALNIKDAGTFQNDEGKLIEYEKHIKIQVGSNFIKVSAIQLAGLLQACKDPEVRKELQSRFEEEKAAMDNVGGF